MRGFFTDDNADAFSYREPKYHDILWFVSLSKQDRQDCDVTMPNCTYSADYQPE